MLYSLYRRSKIAIAEVTSMSGSRDILYSYVATEKDHTVKTGVQKLPCVQQDIIPFRVAAYMDETNCQRGKESL